MAKHTKKQTQKWLKSHQSDVYVKKAHSQGYRSRAAYKLQQMQKKFQLFRPGMNVVDLGAAPGGWSQIVKQYTSEKDHLIALDQIKIDHIPGVTFLQGDFNEDATYDELLDMLETMPLDWVISDMAPDITGNKTIDDARSSQLVEAALDFSLHMLRPGGSFLAKAFDGKSLPEIKTHLKHHFKTLKIHKPDASRAKSSEIYLIAFHKRINTSD